MEENKQSKTINFESGIPVYIFQEKISGRKVEFVE